MRLEKYSLLMRLPALDTDRAIVRPLRRKGTERRR